MTDSATVSAVQLALVFCVALASSLALTPLVRGLAIRLGFVDRPDGDRKTHATPVALGGGAAVLGAVLLAMTILGVLSLVTDSPLLPDRFSTIWNSTAVEDVAVAPTAAGQADSPAEASSTDDADEAPVLAPSRVKAGRFLGGLLVASILIVILGLFDDVFGLRGSYKLLGQIFVVCILIGAGVRIGGLSMREPSLDDVFLRYTGKRIRLEEADAAMSMWY